MMMLDVTDFEGRKQSIVAVQYRIDIEEGIVEYVTDKGEQAMILVDKYKCVCAHDQDVI